MADLGQTFDPNEVPESEHNFGPIPAGQYRVQIVASDVVDLKSGNGRSLVLEFDILDGPYASRKLWDRLNIQHSSEQAQAIAQRSLADLFLATGTPPSRESEDLHFKPCMARVAIDPAKDGYAAKNVIKGYKPVVGVAQAPARPTQAAPIHAENPAATARPAPAPAASGSRPWARARA